MYAGWSKSNASLGALRGAPRSRVVTGFALVYSHAQTTQLEGGYYYLRLEFTCLWVPNCWPISGSPCLSRV